MLRAGAAGSRIRAAGNLIGHWGGPGQGYDWPDSNHGITVDYKGNVWIGGNGRGAPPGRGARTRTRRAGAGQNRQQDESQAGGTQSFNDNMVLKFTQDGKFLMQIGKPARARAATTSRTCGCRPRRSSIQGTNELYVADGYGNHRVIVFDADTGKYKRHWGAYGNKPDDVDLGRYNPNAPPAQQFRNPVHCADLSIDGLLYVCDRVNDRIQVFKPDGTFVKEAFFDKETLGSGSAWDIAFSKDPQQKYIYLADGENDKVHVILRDTLEVLTSFGDGGRQPGEFYGVHSIATDSKGNIYTTETYRGQRVQKFVVQGTGAGDEEGSGRGLAASRDREGFGFYFRAAARLARGGAVLDRIVRVCGSVTDSGAFSLFARIASSSATVPSPIARIGWATVVSGGSMQRAKRMSSKPTIERSSGTRRPRRLAVSTAPIAISSLKQKIAVGRSRRPSSRSAQAAPDSIEKSPFITTKSRSALLLLRARGRAAQAIAAERADQRAGDDPDVAVAEPIQIVHRLGGRLGVVDVDAGDAEPRRELAAVDDRRAPRRHRPHQRRRFLRQPMAEEDQAVGFLPLEHQRVAILARLVVLRVAEQHGVAFALRGVFNSLENQREKWVGDVGHRDEQLAGAQRAQVLGRGVRRVVEELDGLHHFAAGVGRDDVGLAQDTGNGGGGDAGAFGDLVDVGHSGVPSYRRQKCGGRWRVCDKSVTFVLTHQRVLSYPLRNVIGCSAM